MSWTLRLLIRLYWALWPDRWKRGCLYRESCSRYVHRVAAAEGLGAGLRALRARVRTCRPGYGVVALQGQVWLSLADGSIIPGDEAAPAVLGERASAQ